LFLATGTWNHCALLSAEMLEQTHPSWWRDSRGRRHSPWQVAMMGMWIWMWLRLWLWRWMMRLMPGSSAAGTRICGDGGADGPWRYPRARCQEALGILGILGAVSEFLPLEVVQVVIVSDDASVWV